jgi:hypothetical protein
LENRGARSQAFWQLPVTRDADRVRKYEELIALAKLENEMPRREKMRYIAHCWPGALREAELVAPQTIEMRRALCALESGGIERGRWIKGLGCLLACELNGYLTDFLRMRKSARIRRSGWNLGEALDSLTPARRALWPGPECPGLAEHPPGIRIAYLALAWTSGLSLPFLNRLIFERSGHWDRRDEDPDWAHESGPMERLREDVR